MNGQVNAVKQQTAIILAILIPCVVDLPASFLRAAESRAGLAAELTTADVSLLNVRNFGASGDGFGDDGPAIAAAITKANEAAKHGPSPTIYLPAGIYRVAASLPQFFRGGAVLGDGIYKTFIKIDPSYRGDLFSWSESWMDRDFNSDKQTVAPESQKTGASVERMTIIGNKEASNQQHAFVFYGRSDNVLMRDVAVHYLNGRCIYGGVSEKNGVGYIRESQFFNVECRDTGTSSSPAVEFVSMGAGDATDALFFYDIKIIASSGGGLVLANYNTKTSIRNLYFFGLMVHGKHSFASDGTVTDTSRGDLVTIGDGQASGKIANVFFNGAMLNAAGPGYWSMRFAAATPASMPFNIFIEGAITSGANGFLVEAGRSLRFQLTDVAVSDTAFAVGPPPNVGDGIRIDMNGRERSLKYRIDRNSLQFVTVPITKAGDPSAP